MTLVSGCSSNTVDYIHLYEMESFSETNINSKKRLTQSTDIDIFLAVISDASKNVGISDMVDPDYKVELGEDSYFLWLNKDSGTVMHVKDTHTTYNLTEKSVKEVHEVIKRHFAD